MNTDPNVCPQCGQEAEHAAECPVLELARAMVAPIPKTARERQRLGLTELERGPRVTRDPR